MGLFFLAYLVGGAVAAAAYLIGKDAQERGMNPWAWGVFTFLAFFVAIPVYFVVRKPVLFIEHQVEKGD